VTSLAAVDISVIVLNWNGAQFLPRCLQSLREQTWRNIQVLLADNGSTDNSLPLVKRDFPEVEIIDYGQNLGYAEGNNRAVPLSKATYLLFLNNDTWLDPGALASLVSAAKGEPAAAILAPQIRTYDGTEFVSMGIGVDLLGFPCGGKVFYADGAALFVRRDVFRDLGGFDIQHFMFFEETDLCWRAWLHGYRVRTVPSAIVYHKVGGTAGSSSVSEERYITSMSKRRLTHRNQVVNLLKNYSTPTLCVALPLFAVLTAAEVILLLVTGQGRAVRESYLPAWGDLLRRRAQLFATRQAVQSSRTVDDWAILRRMCWRFAMVDHFFHVGMPTIR